MEQVKRRSGQPAVVVYQVVRDDLAGFEGIAFVRGCPDAEDYWAFVQHCRKGRDHARSGPTVWYDVASGPVSVNGRQEGGIIPDYDQFSVHTELVAHWLDGCLKGIEPVRTSESGR